MFFKRKKLRTFALEAYRTTRINLQYLLDKEKAKSVLITSAEKSDGKTTVVKNLALSFASMDKSVIVIDCDFKTCRLSEMFRLNNKPGISDVILGKEQLKFAIFQERDNVSVLPSGTFTDNSDKIICSNMMINILDVLKESYDLIIIDSPSVSQFADAQILSQVAETTVLVVKAGVSKSESLLEGKRLLENVGAKIIGSILVNKDISNKQKRLYISD